MQKKITKEAVERERRRGVRAYVWDTELRGFGCYVSPKGSVSWLVQRWKGGVGGRQVRWVIGQYPHVQPEEAREAAITQLSKIGEAENASDLLTPKQRVLSALRESVREAVQAPKLGECIDTYIKLNRKPGRYWVELKSTFERDIVPVLGKDTIVADITDAEV
jgi:Arm DNA-binding domain